MKERFMRFMMGRYGIDLLGRTTIISGLIAIVLAGVVDSAILSMLAWALVIYSYFRMFSRNIYKRADENQKFLNRTYKIRCWFQSRKNMFTQRKDFHIYKCPTCKQKIRIPRGKGRIEIRCPKCGACFIKNS